nr:MAG TPA: hypothetical protein [Caudoviricetes sp.]
MTMHRNAMRYAKPICYMTSDCPINITFSY